jgi:hypothetical protein
LWEVLRWFQRRPEAVTGPRGEASLWAKLEVAATHSRCAMHATQTSLAGGLARRVPLLE